MNRDDAMMRRALALAERGERRAGSAPIGCVIERDGRVLGAAHNQVGADCDPTAHAEVLAIRRACAALGIRELRGATLYSTLQPCGMCTMAAIWAKISRVVYGAGRGQVHEMYFEGRHFDAADFIRDAYRDDIRIEGGVLAEDCARLYVGPDEAVPAAEQVNR